MAQILAAKTDRLGEVLGDGWQLESVIGSGGTATVYRAARRDGRTAAVKVMHRHLVGSWSRRFEREARLLSTLRHPTIVELYEVGRDGDVPYLVLELLAGESLDRVALPSDLPARTAVVIEHAKQALKALDIVHSHGVLHRDLKPSNLFLTNSGQLKVLDFGAASSEQRDVLTPDSLTTGLLGTPAFMSPEQALGRWDLVDQRSDLWSLAAVMFTLVSGEHVHPAQSRSEQLGRATVQSARRLSTVLPALDARTALILDRALAYRPCDRFPSAAAFLAALEQRDQPLDIARVSDEAPTQSALPQPGLDPQRRPRAPRLQLATLGILSVIALVAVAATRTPHEAATAESEAIEQESRPAQLQTAAAQATTTPLAPAATSSATSPSTSTPNTSATPSRPSELSAVEPTAAANSDRLRPANAHNRRSKFVRDEHASQGGARGAEPAPATSASAPVDPIFGIAVRRSPARLQANTAAE